MEQIIESIVNLIRQAVVSGFLVYIVLAAMLGIATVGMLGSWRRVAGYVLGWLIAIFVIYAFTTSRADITPSDGSLISRSDPIDLSVLIVPGLLGILIGFGLLFVLTKIGDSEGGQAIIIAIVSASAAIMLFFMSVSPGFTRSLIGTFAISFAIGALTYIVARGIPRYHEAVT